MKRAFLFDMNGTMVDDMQYHTTAWHKVLKNLGADLTIEQTKLQMYGKGEEMFDRVFGKDHFTSDRIQEVIQGKELQYQKEFTPHLHLIKGLHSFLDKAKEKGIELAVGTAAPTINVDFVIDGLHLRDYFKVIVDATDVTVSKPDPEVFLKCAELLGVSPENCIVFEDSPKGIEAANNAHMPAVAITSFHEAKDFENFSNVLLCIEDYNDPKLSELFN